MAKEKSAKKQESPKNNDGSISLAESIAKIVITKDTPSGLLAEWAKEYAIDNCMVLVKNK